MTCPVTELVKVKAEKVTRLIFKAHGLFPPIVPLAIQIIIILLYLSLF